MRPGRTRRDGASSIVRRDGRSGPAESALLCRSRCRVYRTAAVSLAARAAPARAVPVRMRVSRGRRVVRPPRPRRPTSARTSTTAGSLPMCVPSAATSFAVAVGIVCRASTRASSSGSGSRSSTVPYDLATESAASDQSSVVRMVATIGSSWASSGSSSSVSGSAQWRSSIRRTWPRYGLRRGREHFGARSREREPAGPLQREIRHPPQRLHRAAEQGAGPELGAEGIEDCGLADSRLARERARSARGDEIDHLAELGISPDQHRRRVVRALHGRPPGCGDIWQELGKSAVGRWWMLHSQAGGREDARSGRRDLRGSLPLPSGSAFLFSSVSRGFNRSISSVAPERRHHVLCELGDARLPLAGPAAHQVRDPDLAVPVDGTANLVERFGERQRRRARRCPTGHGRRLRQARRSASTSIRSTRRARTSATRRPTAPRWAVRASGRSRRSRTAGAAAAPARAASAHRAKRRGCRRTRRAHPS